jgi:hypothetical protein
MKYYNNWKRFINESHNLLDIADTIRDTSKEEAKQELLDNCFKVIGIGQGRAIIRLQDGNVAKIAFNQNGIEQNEQESKVWEQTKSNLLLPVLDTSQSYIIVPYAQVCGEDCEQEINRKKIELKKLLGSIGIASIVDMHNITNWGIHDSQIKLIDYGS